MSIEIQTEPRTLQDALDDLGGVPPARILMSPAPGQATEQDAIRLIERKKILCELVDGVLVEKSMGYAQSILAVFLARLLDEFAEAHNLGSVSGADGFLRLAPGSLRAPDVAFISWGRLPADTLPGLTPVPQVAPELAVEILSDGNTPREMARKREEYFQAGVLVMWEVDPRSRTVAVHRPGESPRSLAAGDFLTADDILPGFRLAIDRLFGRPDAGRRGEGPR